MTRRSRSLSARWQLERIGGRSMTDRLKYCYRFAAHLFLQTVIAVRHRRLPVPVAELWPLIVALHRETFRPDVAEPPLRKSRAWATRQPSIYETLYEATAQAWPDDELAVGGGPFDHVGRMELSVLLMEGLKPTDTLLDFGCGTGRLAVQVIPQLTGGRYIGVDISQTMLDRARIRVGRIVPTHHCDVQWVKQTTAEFPFPEQSIDIICAFSVFTHMEHEDTFNYLTHARKVIRTRGRLVFSCLPMSLRYSQEIFLASAQDDHAARWKKVRNVTTSVELMEAVAKLSGWSVVRWYPGDRPNIPRYDTGELYPFVQSVCVLEASQA
jgi:ubiquinone/menaquinone biosynthesis C-methylase UbiE